MFYECYTGVGHRLKVSMQRNKIIFLGHMTFLTFSLFLQYREVDVVGIFRYKNTWPLCLEFLRSGKIDVKPLITHRFGFSQKEVEEAFETSARGGNAIKVMFNL